MYIPGFGVEPAAEQDFFNQVTSASAKTLATAVSHLPFLAGGHTLCWKRPECGAFSLFRGTANYRPGAFFFSRYCNAEQKSNRAFSNEIQTPITRRLVFSEPAKTRVPKIRKLVLMDAGGCFRFITPSGLNIYFEVYVYIYSRSKHSSTGMF